MSNKVILLGLVFLCLCSVCDAEDAQKKATLTILYDAGIHGRYGPCG